MSSCQTSFKPHYHSITHLQFRKLKLFSLNPCLKSEVLPTITKPPQVVEVSPQLLMGSVKQAVPTIVEAATEIN